MTWEIRDAGWPIPYYTYSTNKKVEREPDPYIMRHRDDRYILPFGYTYFPQESTKGTMIDIWI